MSLRSKADSKELPQAAARLDRSTFLYLEPAPGSDPEFAQCGACAMWTGTTCTILGSSKHVDESDSCNLFIPGTPSFEKEGREEKIDTPEEVGFVNREVRCENCFHLQRGSKSSDGSFTCGLFEKLNHCAPDVFLLNPSIELKACCNAQTSKNNT